jgi:hypothetical protein
MAFSLESLRLLSDYRYWTAGMSAKSQELTFTRPSPSRLRQLKIECRRRYACLYNTWHAIHP